MLLALTEPKTRPVATTQTTSARWVSPERPGSIRIAASAMVRSTNGKKARPAKSDTLPVSTTFIGAWRNDNYWWNVSYPVTPVLVAANYVVWDLGTLDNGYSDNFEVALRVDANAIPGTVLTNTVTISPQPDEDADYDNTSTIVETLRGHGPNLRVRKSYNWNGDDYTQLNYDVVFENVGDQPIYGVWITDTYPLSTTLAGSPWWDYGEQVNWTDNYTDSQLIVQLQELQPGQRGDLWFDVDVDSNLRPRWYTNTVEIGPLAGDVNPADNTFAKGAYDGDLRSTDIRVGTDAANVWGRAVPGTVTVTTAYNQVSVPTNMNGDWNIGSVGRVYPGDTITITAGNGLVPTIIVVPAPFSALASSITGTVWGKIDALNHELVQTELYDYRTKTVQTDGSGNYSASFPVMPRGGNGEVRYPVDLDEQLD